MSYQRVISCCLLNLIAINLAAAAPVWQVSKGDRSLFLAGTVHVLAQADYPLPEEFNKAYQASSVLVFETDMEQVQSLAFQQAMVKAMTYTDGRRLQSVLSAPVYRELSQLVTARGLNMAMFARLKPTMVMLTLTMFELKRLGLGEAGVDAYYYAKAQQDQKRLGLLETAEQQLAFIAGMGEGKENELISYALEDIKTLAQSMAEMKQAWSKGDLDVLENIGIEPMRELFPHMYQTLLVSRNERWLPQIEHMLTTADIELVLVGALHMVGEDGLLAQLRRRGYRIKQLVEKNN